MKDFRELLASEEMLNEKEIISFMPDLINTTHLPKNKTLIARINRFLDSENQKNDGDTEVINYRNWLHSLGLKR